MKKLVLLLVILLPSLTFAQDYTGLGGYLTVNDSTWTLKFQNNEYNWIEDAATLAFGTKEEVQQFYQDLSTAFTSKGDTEFESSNYKIKGSKKTIMIYNTNGQYMAVTKKYFKVGLSQIQDSINFM